MVQQELLERDVPPAKADKPDYLLKKRIKEAKHLVQLAATKSSHSMQEEEADDDQNAAYMMIALDRSPIVTLSRKGLTDEELDSARKNTITQRIENRQSARNYQMFAVQTAMRAFNTRLCKYALLTVAAGYDAKAVFDYIQTPEQIHATADDVKLAMSLIPNFGDPKLSVFLWMQILAEFVPSEGVSFQTHGTLTRLAVRDTCTALRTAYYQSEIMYRKMEDVMFDARVPERVKVLEHFAERRSGPDGALYARPGLRLATQQDLDAVLFSEKDWRRQFMWAGRNTAPTIRIYSFEEPLRPRSHSSRSVQGTSFLESTEVVHDSMFSGRDGRSDNNGQATVELWTATTWQRSVFLKHSPFASEAEKTAAERTRNVLPPAFTVAQIRDIVVGRFRPTLDGDDRDGVYSLHWSPNPHHVGVILNRHQYGWLPMYATQPVAFEAMLGGVAGLPVKEMYPHWNIPFTMSSLGILRGNTCDYSACPGSPNAKLQTCSRCRHARYCSKECQKRDWKMHKLTCDPGHGLGALLDVSGNARQRMLDTFTTMAEFLAHNFDDADDAL